MARVDTIPEPVLARLRERMGARWEPAVRVRGDLTLGRRFGEAWAAASAEGVAVCDSDGACLSVPRAGLKEIRIEELFGSGRLTAVTESGLRPLLTYTPAVAPEMAAFARAASELLAGQPAGRPGEAEPPPYCETCGYPLPGRGERCPRCVSRGRVFLRLLGFMRPYRGAVILLMASTVVTVLAQMAPPYLTKLIVDGVIRDGRIDRLPVYIGLMAGSGLLLLASRYGGGALTSWLASRVIADLRQALHARLARLRMSYFNRHESGELVSRVMHDTSEVRQFLFEGLPFLLVNGLSFLFIAGVLLKLDLRLALLVIVPVPVLLAGGRWFWLRLMPLFYKFGVRMADVQTVLGETIRGVKPIKALSREAPQEANFRRATEGLFGVSYRIDSIFTGFSEVMYGIMALGITAVWYAAGRRLSGGGDGFSLGDLLAFVGYIWLFYGPLQWFTAVLNWMSHAFSAAERLFATLDAPVEVREIRGAPPVPPIRGDVVFEGVRFGYDSGREVIRGVSFHVRPGEMVGLVGKSGAGKSTIIHLLCRFYDAAAGRILVDGRPISEIPLDQLRGAIGLVMQEPFLFNGTILDNIRYGLPDASFEKVAEAARAARAHDFILAKEEGYDTWVGEGGAALSGGEKQRLAIAQAILRDPPILILDEATSSVDTETEKAIQEAIGNLVRNRTTFAIAHRLATLRHARRLIVLEDGRVAEVGTHDELAGREGLYARLVRLQGELSQLRGETWKG